MSATPLDNASLQEASYLKERRANIVVRLLAESLVVVLVVVFGWWGMWGLGSFTLLCQTQPEPIYVAGCPVADQLQKSSTWRGGIGQGRGCSMEGSTHPMTSRHGSETSRAWAWSRKAEGLYVASTSPNF